MLMKKIRAMWPSSHRKEVVDSVKEIRTSAVIDTFVYDCVACREIQKRASYMPSSPVVVMFEGDEVKRLERVWEIWLKYAQ
jgi:hypothetical protein